MKRYSSKSIKGKLDRLVGGFYRSRPCDHCRKDSPSCWAHIKSRRYLSTRWLPTNAFSLCNSCHRWAHDHPDSFTQWIDLYCPGRLKELQRAFNISEPIKKAWLEELYEKLKLELQ
jgi:hypothetical protein